MKNTTYKELVSNIPVAKEFLDTNLPNIKTQGVCEAWCEDLFLKGLRGSDDSHIILEVFDPYDEGTLVLYVDLAVV